MSFPACLTPADIRLLQAALQAADPRQAVQRWVQRDGHWLNVAGKVYDLRRHQRILLVGAGKASPKMGQAVAGILGERLSASLLITKDGVPSLAAGSLTIRRAGHPLPDGRGVAATREIQTLLEGAGMDDLVLCVLSGGGSALLTAPAEGIRLADLQYLTRRLLASGASIQEINILRKHLDLVKGGGLARLAYPATLVTLILSDVVGDPLDGIASGPSAADPSTYTGAWGVLEKYGLAEDLPPPISRRLQAGRHGRLPENLKPGDPRLERVQNLIIGNNQQAAEALLAEARRQGCHTHLLTTSLQGEARQAGEMLAGVLRQVAERSQPVPPPACLVAGGETTVTLRGEGKGGRNQELALAAACGLGGLDGALLISLATDGQDGPTDAAGAAVSGATCQQALAAGMDPREFLEQNNSYPLLDRLGALLKTGPTGTNVNDLVILLKR